MTEYMLRSLLKTLSAFALSAAAGASVAQADDVDALLASEPAADVAVEADSAEPALDTIPVTVRKESPLAEVDEAAPVLDEIVVTAQKRPQKEIDVSTSLTVMDRDFLTQEGINDYSKLGRYASNVRISTDVATGQSVAVRGFGKQTGNPAFEQSVGLSIDGVSYDDNDYFTTVLFDLDRVEVLRGPQGTLSGKNTTAGLLNITTMAPDYEYSGHLAGEIGQDNRRRVDSAFGGQLIEDVVNFRIAGVIESRDGVIRNTTGRVVPGVPTELYSRDRNGVRARLQFPNVLGSKLDVTYERTAQQIVGQGREITMINQAGANFLRRFDPNADFEPGNFVTSVDDPEGTERTIEKFLLAHSMALGEWDLTTLLGHSRVDSVFSGGDGTPAPIFETSFGVEKPQTTAEMRLLSAKLPGFLGLSSLFGHELGDSDLIFGVNYTRRELIDFFQRLEFDTLLFAEWMSTGNPDGEPLAEALQGILSLLPNLDNLPDELHEVSTVTFNQKSDTYSVFGQFDWRFAERWSFLTGLRFSTEDKAGDWAYTFDSPNSLFNENVLNCEEFTAQRKRSERQLQPKVGLNYRPHQNFSLFLHRATGFKAGGFNAFPCAPEEDALTFDDEKVVEWALNAKTIVLDGTMRFNAGIFMMELTDFQLLTRAPNQIIAGTTNAGSIEAIGAEADVTWLPAHWLMMIGSLGYNRTEFTDFVHGPCANDRPDTDNDGDPRCSLTGQPIPNAPEWVATVTTQASVPLGLLGLTLGAGMTVEYVGDYYAGIPGDERFEQPSFVRLGANLGLSSERGGWSLRVLGENLTNESTATAIAQFTSVPHIYEQLEPPRHVYAELRWQF